MKILLLMPCDERNIYEAQAIYNNLSAELKEQTFAMPCFMQYLVTTNLVKNWITAFYYSLVAAKNICKATETKDNLIIIGNVPKDFKFDSIFNFQMAEKSLPYEDKFITKIKEAVSEDEKLTALITNLYEAKDSQYSLHNCKATAQFLDKYIKTDFSLEEINQKIQEYEESIKRKNVYGYNKESDRK